jgi:hypothetical protein
VELGAWQTRTTTVELPAGYLGATRYQRRRYFLKVPVGYDHNRAYEIVITASACVGQEESPTAIDYSAVTSVVGGAIQIAPVPLLGFPGAHQTAPSDPYSLGYGVDCRKYRCPQAFPVVFCEAPGGHGPVSWQAAATWLFFDTLP